LPCVLTTPWAGSSGLPNVAASAVVAVAVPAAAPAARMLRRETVLNGTSKSSSEDLTVLRDCAIKDFHLLRTGSSSAQGSYLKRSTFWFPSKYFLVPFKTGRFCADSDAPCSEITTMFMHLRARHSTEKCELEGEPVDRTANDAAGQAARRATGE
jgi:hypothetical protein